MLSERALAGAADQGLLETQVASKCSVPASSEGIVYHGQIEHFHRAKLMDDKADSQNPQRSGHRRHRSRCAWDGAAYGQNQLLRRTNVMDTVGKTPSW